jgi:hypothetical protein
MAHQSWLCISGRKTMDANMFSPSLKKIEDIFMYIALLSYATAINQWAQLKWLDPDITLPSLVTSMK